MARRFWYDRLPRRWIAGALTLGLLAATGLPRAVIAAPPRQTGTEIHYGETVTGTITETVACQMYWFEGMAGDPVTIDMQRTSGGLDGVLTLYQGVNGPASAPPIAENDDRPNGRLDPLITLQLPATDRYTIAACRLDHPQMRVTIGTFSLTLTGPDSAAPVTTPTGPPVLSASMFGTPENTPTAAETPTSASASLFANMATPVAEQAFADLSSGQPLPGELSALTDQSEYVLPVHTGDLVQITWQSTGGAIPPRLTVFDSRDEVLAEASAPVAVPGLVLRFRAPTTETLRVVVTRSIAGDSTPSTFTMTAQIEATPGTTTDALPNPAQVVTPTPEAAQPANYLETPCQTGGQAVSGMTSSARLIDVFTASGDSYYVDQLTRTTVFKNDDDLNVVFRVQNITQAINVAGVFCAPDGDYYDAGENTYENGGPYMLGIDWEYEGVPWVPGDWFAEVYVNGAPELTLGFSVQ